MALFHSQTRRHMINCINMYGKIHRNTKGLTHLNRINLPTLIISRTSPFPILGVLGGILLLFLKKKKKKKKISNFNKTYCEQIVKILDRRHMVWWLISIWTSCLCYIKIRINIRQLPREILNSSHLSRNLVDVSSLKCLVVIIGNKIVMIDL